MKKYYCIKCEKKISDYRVKRCRLCADKQHSVNMKGNKNPAFKEGKPKCVDCRKLLSNYTAKRCQECYHKYIKRSGKLKGRIKSLSWKKKISKTMIRKGVTKGKNNPMFGKITHGKWGIYKGIKMRSSYEIAYAKWLDKHGYKWLYESKTFDLGNMTYTPDFYLLDKNMYIEVKGYWRLDAKKKFFKFQRLYPEINIQIENYKLLKKKGILK